VISSYNLVAAISDVNGKCFSGPTLHYTKQLMQTFNVNYVI